MPIVDRSATIKAVENGYIISKRQPGGFWSDWVYLHFDEAVAEMARYFGEYYTVISSTDPDFEQ